MLLSLEVSVSFYRALSLKCLCSHCFDINLDLFRCAASINLFQRVLFLRIILFLIPNKICFFQRVLFLLILLFRCCFQRECQLFYFFLFILCRCEILMCYFQIVLFLFILVFVLIYVCCFHSRELAGRKIGSHRINPSGLTREDSKPQNLISLRRNRF